MLSRIIRVSRCSVHLKKGKQLTRFSWHAVSTKASEDKDDTSVTAAEEPTALTSSIESSELSPNALLSTTFRGIGQVIFLNSPTSGGLIWLGLCASNPYLAGLGLLGAATATATAHQFLVDKKGNDNGNSMLPFRNGLYGYNGALVGCAASVNFLIGPVYSTSIPACIVATMVGAAMTPLVQTGLGKYVCTASPQWTYAFNIVTLSTLGLATSLSATAAAANNASTNDIVATVDAATPTTTALVDASVQSPQMVEVLSTPLIGMAQIFLVESAISGGLILGGIALYSPGLAIHALLGSSIGSGLGVICGADTANILSGLWGYNSALSSMAVGVFYAHSMPTMALSAASAGATALVFAGTTTTMSMLGSDLPCLTLPFCVTMSAVYTLTRNSSLTRLASSPHSPEKNEPTE